MEKMDLTELPGLDNLHFPNGPIKEAQELAARAFGAEKTYFLVNGSTCGIHAMILAICKRGDRLIVGRDCHQSVIHGMMLAGVSPLYVNPLFDMEFGIPSIMPLNIIDTLLKENPAVVGVLLTRPNYYGVCFDISKIANIVHSHGKILAIDEAHGAHLKFSAVLPLCALEGGADICVQSAHKTLPALTQGAYLHVNSSRLDTDHLEYILRMLQTSSPSYLIMAFLDIAREIMECNGYRLLTGLVNSINKLHDYIANNTNLNILSDNNSPLRTQDITRIVINFKELGISGFFAEKILREKHNIQVEMSDFYNIICIATVSDSEDSFEILKNALVDMSKSYNPIEKSHELLVGAFEIPIQKISYDEILYLKGIPIDFKKSEGAVSKCAITPYPPGVPIICPGEVITKDAIDYLSTIISNGAIVTGLSENREILIV
jgi:arginine decarboxylase